MATDRRNKENENKENETDDALESVGPPRVILVVTASRMRARASRARRSGRGKIEPLARLDDVLWHSDRRLGTLTSWMV